jgi:6-phosphogluconolactonase
MTIKIFENTGELSQFFAEMLINQVNKKDETDFFSIALSGGSTPKAIFEYLSLNYKEKINWERIKLFWGDERCVEPENDESNYKMTQEFFLNHISIPEKNVFRISGEEIPEIEALSYEEIVKIQLKLKSGIPKFDLIMLGLGEDGHIASIFPDNLHLFETDKLYAATQNPYNKQNRITATGKLINNASMIVFLVIGESKAKKVSQIINKTGDGSNLPASLVKPVNGEVYWLLDDMAASGLNYKNH